MDEHDLIQEYIVDLVEILGISYDDYTMLESLGYDYRGLKALHDINGFTVQELIGKVQQGIDNEVYSGRTFRHDLMAEWMEKHLSVVKIYDAAMSVKKAALAVYYGGKYHNDTFTIEQFIHLLKPDLIASQRKEVLAALRLSRTIKCERKSDPKLIPFRTQVYDIEMQTFSNHTPKNIFLNRLPYDFKPNAPAQPVIDNLLDKITDGDKEVRQLILEAFGSCFYTSNKFRGSFWLVGNGRNGKSTLLNLLQQMLGQENVSHLSAQAMQNQFRVGELESVLANIGDDIPKEYIKDDSIMKQAITGEALTSETKHDPVMHSFVPYAKFFFAMNSMPRIDDSTQGLYSRVKIIPLNHDFTNEDDVSMKDRDYTVAEIEYLIRLSIEAFTDVMCRGYFIDPQRAKDAMHDYKRLNNSEIAFMEDEHGGDVTRIIDKPRKGVYEAYKQWCSDNGITQPLKMETFTQRIDAEYGTTYKNMRANGSAPQKCFVMKK